MSRQAADDDFGDVVAGDAHLHGADLDFEVMVVERAADDGRGGRWT